MAHRLSCNQIGATQLSSLSGAHRVAHVASQRTLLAGVQRSVECAAASTSGVKLPATHLQASQAALQSIADSAKEGVNREYIEMTEVYRLVNFALGDAVRIGIVAIEVENGACGIGLILAQMQFSS